MIKFIPLFVVGLAGSLHCLGMCSPLMLATSRGQSMRMNLFYNGGRIITYALMGAAVSLVGAGFEFMGIQQWISVVVGIALLIAAIFRLTLRLPATINKPLVGVVTFLKMRYSFLTGKGAPGRFAMGMINGLLPCGLTLAALAYCITFSRPSEGFMAMIFFGFGTLPAMTGAALIMKSLSSKFNVSYQAIQTMLLIVSAVLLMIRGVATVDNTFSHGNNPSEIVVCGPGS